MKLTNRHFRWILGSLLSLSLLYGAVLLARAATGPSLSTTPAGQKKKAGPKYYRINANNTVRVRLNQSISSKSARVGDTFSTTVVEPVHSTNGIELIPAGATISGRVIAAQPAQKKGKPGTVDVVFYKLRLPNGRVQAINGSLTSLDEGGTASDNEGTASGKKTAHRKAKFIGGGAAGGALIGALAGGGKGALIGAGVGAGAGAIGGRLTKGKEAEVKAGTEFGVILNQSISLPAFRAT